MAQKLGKLNLPETISAPKKMNLPRGLPSFSLRKKKMDDKHAFFHPEERKLLISSFDDFSVLEAYKTLRTNVMFSLADVTGCKILMFTSCAQGEGKSLTAANLSISLAQAENRVLLIDCDLRRPKLARLMEEDSELGLTDLLLAPDKMGEVLKKTSIPNLDMITSGSVPPNPSELLGSARMSTLLQVLRRGYNYIILDSPPVNLVTDSTVLSTKCDGVLFVVRANQTEKGEVLHAMEQLQYANARILGFVLNGVTSDNNQTGYGRYTYKRYAGYYGQGEAEEKQ